MYGGRLTMAYETRSQGTTGGLDIARILGIVGIFILAARTAAQDPLAENPFLAYYDAQATGAVENVARLRGAQIEDAGFADYLGRTIPVTLPGSIGAAFVLDWLLRKKWSPLNRRDAVGVDVPRRVEKRLAKGVKHPAGAWAIGMTPKGEPVAIDDAH